MWNLDGPYCVRFASRLIYYQGAVVAKIQHDQKEREESDDPTSYGEKPVSTTKMSMSDAMGKYGDDLDSLNYESEAAMGGTLFERVTIPAEN